MDRAVMILGQVSLGPSRVSKSVRTRNAGAKNLMITELFYSHILNMNRGSLHTKSFRRDTSPGLFRGFREMSPEVVFLLIDVFFSVVAVVA